MGTGEFIIPVLSSDDERVVMLNNFLCAFSGRSDRRFACERATIQMDEYHQTTPLVRQQLTGPVRHHLH